MELLDAAEERAWLKVPWWDIRVPEAQRVLGALLRAHDRGADVRVIIRPDRECEAVLKALDSAGVRVMLRRNEHVKELLADGAYLSLSMNLSRKEIRVNQQAGSLTTEPDKVAVHAAALEADFEQSQVVASAGEPVWRAADEVVPPSFLSLLTHLQLNPLQSMAVPVVLDTDRHLLVVAPTGAGKTLIGQVAALRAIKIEGRKAAWLVPARALAAEVGRLRDLWRPHGIDVVELTGEDNLDSERLSRAHMWVTTTEKFEALYRRGSLAKAVTQIGCVIVDEVHLVGDPTRGPTLEAMLARLRQLHDRTRIVALSATAANADELASWLQAELVQTTWRPTELSTQVVTYAAASDRWADIEAAKDAAVGPIVEDFISPDENGEHGSVLIFCGAKKSVRQLAAKLAGVSVIDDEEALLQACLKQGVAFHYRGSPRSHAVLQQFKDRVVGILVATSGLAVGVNTPARAVIVRDLTLGMDDIEVSQVQQMFGRAGRAGQEDHGWAFLLCPIELAGEWQRRLYDGYSVSSHIAGRLADAILAEVLLGGVVDVTQARQWFAQTFAAWLTGSSDAGSEQLTGIDTALQQLVELGLVKLGEGGELTATELGGLTSRLMVEVAAVAALLPALAAIPLPQAAHEAELLLLRTVGAHVPALAEPAVNPKDYIGLVDEVLGRQPGGLTPQLLASFGADFTVAAARMALEQPGRLKKPRGSLSMLPVRETVDQLPRYLAWIAALGRLGLHAWAPAAGGDLARRLAWWHLSPAPGRGSGRLLWFLERLLPVGQQKEQIQQLWESVRKYDYATPDRINSSPVSIAERAFSRLLGDRITPTVGEPVVTGRSLTLPVAGSAAARMSIQVGYRGSRTSTLVDRHQDGIVICPIPSAAQGQTQLALDIVWYSNGDAACTSALIEVDIAQHVRVADPLQDVRTLAAALPESLAVQADVGLLRKLLRPSKVESDHLIRLASGTPELSQVALAIAGEFGSTQERAHRLRSQLGELLTDRENGLPPRPPTEVLRSLVATTDEHALTLAALAASAGIPSGLAQGKTSRKLFALVEVDGRWYVLQGPRPGSNVTLQPLFPAGLPGQLVVLPVPTRQSQPLQPTVPHLGFLADFLPSG